MAVTVAEVLSPGNKVDIRLIQQIENSEKTGELAKVYKSQVLDIKRNGNVEISMPSEGTRLILLPLGVRFEFVFYAKGFLYRSMGQVKERYKRDNLYMLEIELKSQLEKFQRREYYRFDCTLPMTFYVISDDQAKYDSIEQIFVELRDDNLKEKEQKGTIVDISGGGIRFNSSNEYHSGENLLIGFHLVNEKMDKLYYVAGKIITCYRLEHMQEKRFECRVKFMMKDDRVREEIIRYIFEEERRTRQYDRK